MLSESVGRLLDDLIICAGFTFKMDDIQRVLVHLLNYEADFTDAPDIFSVSNVHEGVDFEFSYLPVPLRFDVD